MFDSLVLAFYQPKASSGAHGTVNWSDAWFFAAETVLSIEEPEPERASERPGPMVAHPLTDDQSAPQREMIPQASRSDVGDEDAECIEADDELVGADALAYDGPKLAESEQGLTPGYSISDEAWERITQSMLGGFGAEKSET